MVKVVSENYRLQKWIAALAVFLFLIKVVAYLMTNSTAIMADVMETSVNVAAAFIGLFAIYISAQPADASHPFGHGRIELISALIEGSMITIAGVLMIVESLDALVNPHEISDLGIGILLIIGAGVANFIAGRIAIAKGNKNRSPALVASGKHLVSDTYVAIGVILGLGLVYLAMSMGYDAIWLDAVVALVFSLFIIVTGIKVVKSSMDDIMDKADNDVINMLAETFSEHRDPDWIDVYGLRVIKHGPKFYVDFHVVLPKSMTVQQVADETTRLEFAIMEKLGEAVEISVTPVPCEDVICAECSRVCDNRGMHYESAKPWTVETLTADHPMHTVHADHTPVITEIS